MITSGNARVMLVCSSNGNPLDEYTAEAVFFHRKFRIGDWKLPGWKRLVGQEVPTEAYSDLLTIAGQSIFPAAATDLTDVNGLSAAGGAVSASVNTRELVHIVSGPQTPKAQQPELDLWIPLSATTSRLTRQTASRPWRSH
jgi:hypothetical protein